MKRQQKFLKDFLKYKRKSKALHMISLFTMSQDFGYCEEENYDYSIDKVLEMYEEAAKNEQYYLLHTKYPVINSALDIQCAISPARTFSPVVILQNGAAKIVLSIFEWQDMLVTLKLMQSNFFESSAPPNTVAAPVSCGEFLHLSQITHDDVKQVMIMRHLTSLYLYYSDVIELLKMEQLITCKINLLGKVDFCKYYFNVLEEICSWKHLICTQPIEKLLASFCHDNSSMLSTALREYIFYYKDKIFDDIVKIKGF